MCCLSCYNWFTNKVNSLDILAVFPLCDMYLLLQFLDGDKNDAGIKAFMKLISIVGVFLSFLSVAFSKLTMNIVWAFAGDWFRMTVSIYLVAHIVLEILIP